MEPVILSRFRLQKFLHYQKGLEIMMVVFTEMMKFTNIATEMLIECPPITARILELPDIRKRIGEVQAGQ